MRIEKARQNGVLPAHQEGPGVELTLNMPGRKGYALLFPAADRGIKEAETVARNVFLVELLSGC